MLHINEVEYKRIYNSDKFTNYNSNVIPHVVININSYYVFNGTLPAIQYNKWRCATKNFMWTQRGVVINLFGFSFGLSIRTKLKYVNEQLVPLGHYCEPEFAALSMRKLI